MLPCLERISESVKSEFPDVPFFIFPKGAHYCHEALNKTKFDVISLDWTQKISKVIQIPGFTKTV